MGLRSMLEYHKATMAQPALMSATQSGGRMDDGAGRTTLLGSSPMDEFGMSQMSQNEINIGSTRVSESWLVGGAGIIGNKSELCKKWLEDGSCMIPECNFAHGQKELVIPSSVGLGLFKAELCIDMRDKGYCVHGDMCQFSHSSAAKRDYQE